MPCAPQRLAIITVQEQMNADATYREPELDSWLLPCHVRSWCANLLLCCLQITTSTLLGHTSSLPQCCDSPTVSFWLCCGPALSTTPPAWLQRLAGWHSIFTMIQFHCDCQHSVIARVPCIGPHLTCVGCCTSVSCTCQITAVHAYCLPGYFFFAVISVDLSNLAHQQLGMHEDRQLGACSSVVPCLFGRLPQKYATHLHPELQP